MNHLHAVSIRKRAAVSLAVLCLGLGVGACSGFPGSHNPSRTAKSTPVTDEYICGGALSTQQLKETLDYEILSYRYNNGPIKPNDGSGRIEYIYNCNTTSYANSDPFGLLELSYASSDLMGDNPGFDGWLYFYDIPSHFPNTAKAVELDGEDGEGWSWTADNGAYIAWRYPDGTMLYVRLTSADDNPVTPEQQDALL